MFRPLAIDDSPSKPYGSLIGNETDQALTSFATNASAANRSLFQGSVRGRMRCKVERLRDYAKSIGLPGVAEAWQHFLNASGESIPLPEGRALEIRRCGESAHQQQVLDWVTSSAGARGMLALRGLVKVDGTVKPEEKWPKVVKFKLELDSTIRCENEPLQQLGYFRPEVKSEFTVNAVLQAESQVYKLSILSWRSWAMDHFDVSAPNQFLGDQLTTGLDLPTSREIRLLIDLGEAMPFQRTSSAWKAEFTSPAWSEGFEDEATILREADTRRESLSQPKASDSKPSQPV